MRNIVEIKEVFKTIDKEEILSGINLQIAEGEIYVLGDNPAESIDSREVGPLQAKDLRGDCVFVVWPLRDWGVVAQPE